MSIEKRSLSSLERCFVAALAAGNATSELIDRFPGYTGLINRVVHGLLERAAFESLEELERDCVEGGKMRDVIEEAVANQDFEKAAAARDHLYKERKFGRVIHGSTKENAIERLQEELESHDPESGTLCLLVDPGSAPADAVAELLAELSKLYRMVGGSGITFVPTEIRNPEVMT